MKNKLKTKNYEISYKNYIDILNFAIKNGNNIKKIMGVLNDTYIIYNFEKNMIIGKCKARKFIILYPKFETTQSDTFNVFLTDNEEELKKFKINKFV